MLLGEANSVLSNIMAVGIEKRRLKETPDQKPLYDEPSLYTFIKENNDQQILDLVRGKYVVKPNEGITFDVDLNQQLVQGRIPLAAVWFQALIDAGRIKNIAGFEDVATVRQAVERIGSDNASIINEIKKDVQPIRRELEVEEAKTSGVEVNTEDLFFVTSVKDLPKWLPILARCKNQPRGILVYDHNRVRLENFASEHRGDKEALTEQLRLGIHPDKNNGFIDWEKQLLQADLTPDKLTGYRRHVVAEKYLTNRRSIRKSPQGVLTVV
jgi:hypothetical protein